MKSWVPISELAGPFKFLEQWVPGCTCTPLLYAVFTGLAQFASALGNGPRQALGEEVELSRLKRKAAPSFESSLGGGGSLMAKKALVDPRPPLVAEKTVKEKLLFKQPLNVSQHSVKENPVKEKESFFQKVPLEESSSQALSQDLSGFSQELSGLSQNGDSLNPPQDDCHSGFSKSVSQVSLFKDGVSHKESMLKGGSQSGVRRDGVEEADARKFKQSMRSTHKSSSVNSDKSSSVSSRKSSSVSSHKSSSGGSHKSSSQESSKQSSQSLHKVKSSQELSLTNFASSQRLFSQRSDSQRSNTQRSNTQRSDTQRSNTQMSGPKVSSSQGSLLSDSQAYRIPRVQSTLGEDDVTRKTAFLMGSFAKSVMEGGAAMLREYLDATNKGSNSG